MAVNERFWDANRVSLPVGAGTLSGDPVRVGFLNAVAITDSAVSLTAGANAGFNIGLVASVNRYASGNAVGWASCKTTGAFIFTVTAAGAVAVGDPIYAIANGDTTIKKVALTTSASGNKLYGIATEAAASGTPKIAVKIAQITV